MKSLSEKESLLNDIKFEVLLAVHQLGEWFSVAKEHSECGIARYNGQIDAYQDVIRIIEKFENKESASKMLKEVEGE